MVQQKNITKKASTSLKKCPQCGVLLRVAVLSGMCPNCLLQQGVKVPPPNSGKFFDLPSIESLSKSINKSWKSCASSTLGSIEFIAQGGMGAIYKARESVLDRTVAVKIMPPRAADGGCVIFRFEREARLLARLKHPNVVAIYHFDLAGDYPFFVMDYVDGSTLRQILKAGAMEPKRALELFFQMCDGLQHAHENGVIHRDIKPENLLVDKNDRLKIVDFGLARLDRENPTGEWQTLDGHRMGTPHYMAPEQVEQPLAVDHRADIYSAGVVLYEMLTGELPLGRFASPSSKAKTNPALDAEMFRALAKEPDFRHQDINHFKYSVQAALKGKTAVPSQPEEIDNEQRAKQLLEHLQNNPDDINAGEQLKHIYIQLNFEPGITFLFHQLGSPIRAARPVG